MVHFPQKQNQFLLWHSLSLSLYYLLLFFFLLCLIPSLVSATFPYVLLNYYFIQLVSFSFLFHSPQNSQTPSIHYFSSLHVIFEYFCFTLTYLSPFCCLSPSLHLFFSASVCWDTGGCHNLIGGIKVDLIKCGPNYWLLNGIRPS